MTDKTSISNWRIAKGRLMTTFIFFFPGKIYSLMSVKLPQGKTGNLFAFPQEKGKMGRKNCADSSISIGLWRDLVSCVAPESEEILSEVSFYDQSLCKVSLPFSSVVESLILVLTVLMEDSAPLSDLTLSCKLCFPSARK